MIDSNAEVQRKMIRERGENERYNERVMSLSFTSNRFKVNRKTLAFQNCWRVFFNIKIRLFYFSTKTRANNGVKLESFDVEDINLSRLKKFRLYLARPFTRSPTIFRLYCHLSFVTLAIAAMLHCCFALHSIGIVIVIIFLSLPPSRTAFTYFFICQSDQPQVKWHNIGHRTIKQA